MKKILGISLVAVLAATPLMARADITYPVDPSAYALQDGITDNTKGTANPTQDQTELKESDLASDGTGVTIAEGGKYFAGKEVTSADAGIVATGAYVKGAYNAAISAVNALGQELDTAISNVTLTEGDAIDIDANNKINVVLTDKKGLQIDAEGNSLEVNNGNGIDINSTSGAIEVKASDAINVSANGVAVKYDNSTIKLNASGQLEAQLGDYATKTGVINTIESATVHTLNNVSVASSGVTAYTDWAAGSTTTLGTTTLSTSEAYVPVVITASDVNQDNTISTSGELSYEDKWHESAKVSVASDQTTVPNTYVAPQP